MRGLIYQLKSVRNDKFCMMSFLLPIIVAVALHFAGTIDLSSVGEMHFGALENDLSAETISWLERYGSVTFYQTTEELTGAVKEPSTDVIGVTTNIGNGNGSEVGIQTMVAGDELEIFRQIADTLPVLYAERKNAEKLNVRVLERSDIIAGLQNVFLVITLIVAVFMGCTFNAMNIISEKENGVALANQILPMTHAQYVVQKIFVGFVCGCLSAVITVCICFRLSFKGMLLMLALIVLSAFVSALIGLFIGRFSENLMVGVVYVKIVMIVFMAVPLLSYLLGVHGLVLALCYVVPSTATFEGVMHLADSTEAMIAKEVLILVAHCVVWFLLYLSISKRPKKRL